MTTNKLMTVHFILVIAQLSELSLISHFIWKLYKILNPTCETMNRSHSLPFFPILAMVLQTLQLVVQIRLERQPSNFKFLHYAIQQQILDVSSSTIPVSIFLRLYVQNKCLISFPIHITTRLLYLAMHSQ